MKDTVTCVDVNGKKYEVSKKELKWRPSVYGIVIKDGCVLLSKQFGDRYDLPGGGVDLGEELTVAVIREVKEETGIDAANPRVLSVENSFFHAAHATKDSYHSVMIYYACEYVGGELSVEGFDEWEKEYAEMAEWIPLDTIDGIQLASSVDFRQYIKLAAQL